jgi:hypothetical protein
MDQYGIQLNFDAEFEPPRVYIADRQGMGCCYIEVIEEPQLVLGRIWSWKDKDWEVGEITVKLLKFMNSKEFGI